MKKESVRKQEARDLMKKRAGQAAAAMGVAGTGTVFAASAFADGAEPLAEDDAEVVAEVETEEQVSEPQPAQKPAHSHQSQSSPHVATAAAAQPQQEEIVDDAPIEEQSIDEEEIEEGAIENAMESEVAEVPADSPEAVQAFTPFNAVSSGVYEASSIEMEDVSDGFIGVDSDDMVEVGDEFADIEASGDDFSGVSIGYDDIMPGNETIDSDLLENDFGIDL